MDLNQYYAENKGRINSSIMEIASDLAEARLVEKHRKSPEEFVEPENPDGLDNNCVRYKEEYQDEYNEFYDEEYERVASLMKFDFGEKNGIARSHPTGNVQIHSFIGHNSRDDCEDANIRDPDRVIITDKENETVEVITTPQINPGMFRRRVQNLMLSGLPLQEAEKFVASTPLKLELFYDIDRGGFAIDAEAVGNMPLYNPYTGKEISDETE